MSTLETEKHIFREYTDWHSNSLRNPRKWCKSYKFVPRVVSSTYKSNTRTLNATCCPIRETGKARKTEICVNSEAEQRVMIYRKKIPVLAIIEYKLPEHVTCKTTWRDLHQRQLQQLDLYGLQALCRLDFHWRREFCHCFFRNLAEDYFFSSRAPSREQQTSEGTAKSISIVRAAGMT
jgi:hypothetical protein